MPTNREMEQMLTAAGFTRSKAKRIIRRRVRGDDVAAIAQRLEETEAMKRHAKELVKELEALGYEFERINSKSMHVYVRNGAEIIVSPGVDDNSARQILRKVKRDLGCVDEVAKRKPDQIKARQAAERERAADEVARLDRERDELLFKRNRLLNGNANGLTRRQIRDIEELIQAKDDERRMWESLMKGVPSSADHRGKGQARHRAGGAA